MKLNTIWNRIEKVFSKIESDGKKVVAVSIPISYMKVIERRPFTLKFYDVNGNRHSELDSLCYVENFRNLKWIWGAKIIKGKRIKAYEAN